ncbi:MAG: hypothetical protein WCC17_19420 [Candidatus Nitrosopolaris sp.]|jgi:hypothetical protein
MEKRVQGSDYESVTELAIHCKKEGVSLEDLVSVLRIKNYIQQLGSIDEERVEQFIARCALHKTHKDFLTCSANHKRDA